jgi:hypothetical protein
MSHAGIVRRSPDLAPVVDRRFPAITIERLTERLQQIDIWMTTYLVEVI